MGFTTEEPAPQELVFKGRKSRLVRHRKQLGEEHGDTVQQKMKTDVKMTFLQRKKRHLPTCGTATNPLSSVQPP